MANKHASLDALFTDIADAIREKTGDTGTIAAAQIPSVIRSSLEKKVVLISFTIDRTSYQAEEGMTWTIWCGTGYNTAGFYIGIIDDINVVRSASGNWHYVIPGTHFGNPVGPGDTITDGNTYMTDNSPILL